MKLLLSAFATLLFASTLPAFADKVGAGEVQAVLQEIQAEYRWKGAAATPEFVAGLAPRFDHWGQVLSRLSESEQRAEADRICAAIVALQNHWGPEMVRWDAFLRDRFFVGDLRVDAVQFFAPVPIYPGDPTIMKLYRFSLYKEGKVVARYYLEHSQLDGKPENSYYVLGLSTHDSHRQVQPYGRELPPYWSLKQAVLRDLTNTRSAK